MPRTLSEPEFEAIKAKILDAAPPGLKEDDFNRYVGPALQSAIGEAENSSEPITGSAIGRFAAGAWKNLNPANLIDAAMHPVDTAGAILQSQLSEADKARQAFKEGRYSEALGHAAATALPVVGPVAASAGEKIAAGDWAGGAGEGVGLVTPLGARIARVPIGRATEAAGRGAEALAGSYPAKLIGGYQAVKAGMHGNLLTAAAMAATPYATEVGGRILQRVGKAIAGDPDVATAPHLDRSIPMRPSEMTQQQLAERINMGVGEPASKPPKLSTIQPKSIVQAIKDVDEVAKEAKIKLSYQEVLAGTKAIAQGMSPEDALAAIKLARLGGVSDAEVASVVAAKNARTAK